MIAPRRVLDPSQGIRRRRCLEWRMDKWMHIALELAAAAGAALAVGALLVAALTWVLSHSD